MATSTFGKKFKVTPEKAYGFVEEMTKEVPPTLKGDFKSNLKHEKELKESLLRTLR